MSPDAQVKLTVGPLGNPLQGSNRVTDFGEILQQGRVGFEFRLDAGQAFHGVGFARADQTDEGVRADQHGPQTGTFGE